MLKIQILSLQSWLIRKYEKSSINQHDPAAGKSTLYFPLVILGAMPVEHYIMDFNFAAY
jgi:hypothetical protein